MVSSAAAVAGAGGDRRHPGGYAIAISVKIRMPFSGAPNGHEYTVPMTTAFPNRNAPPPNDRRSQTRPRFRRLQMSRNRIT